MWYWITSWCASLGKTVSPSLSTPSLPVALCVARVLMVPLQFSISVVPIQLVFRQPHSWDFMGVASGVARRHSLTENPLILWVLQSLNPHFHNVPHFLGYFVDLSFRSSWHNSTYLLGVIFFSNGLYLVKVLDVKTTLIWGIRTNNRL